MPENGFTSQDRANIATLVERTTNMQGQIKGLRDTMVTKDSFKPVQLIAYGLAGGVLLTVLGAILATSLKGG